MNRSCDSHINPLSVSAAALSGSELHFLPQPHVIWMSQNVASQTSCCCTCSCNEETLGRSDIQTGNQPLNQICNLTLSTTQHWIPFSSCCRLDPSQSCIHIQISVALCSSGYGAVAGLSVWQLATRLQPESDGNQTKLDQYRVSGGEGGVLSQLSIRELFS